MKWIDQIRAKLSRKRYMQIEPVNGKYERDFLNLSGAVKVGLIVNLTKISEVNLAQIRHFLDMLLTQKKELLVIELNFQKKSEPVLQGSYNHIFINPLDLDWLRFPSEEIIDQLQALSMDVLLNLDQSDQITSKYLCSVMNARTRVGIHEEGFEDCYEVMIAHQPVDQVEYLIQTFEGYLSMTRK